LADVISLNRYETAKGGASFSLLWIDITTGIKKTSKKSKNAIQ
jgi:hypothetical protein